MAVGCSRTRVDGAAIAADSPAVARMTSTPGGPQRGTLHEPQPLPGQRELYADLSGAGEVTTRA